MGVASDRWKQDQRKLHSIVIARSRELVASGVDEQLATVQATEFAKGYMLTLQAKRMTRIKHRG